MAPHLRKVEKDVLIPRLMEYRISHELCREESRIFSECMKEAGFSVVTKCRDLREKFEECANRWFRDEEFRQKMTDEYIAKRTKYRETGVAEKSPFSRH